MDLVTVITIATSMVGLEGVSVVVVHDPRGARVVRMVERRDSHKGIEEPLGETVNHTFILSGLEMGEHRRYTARSTETKPISQGLPAHRKMLTR
jgi:hypothetical protein